MHELGLRYGHVAYGRGMLVNKFLDRSQLEMVTDQLVSQYASLTCSLCNLGSPVVSGMLTVVCRRRGNKAEHNLKEKRDGKEGSDSRSRQGYSREPVLNLYPCPLG